MTATLSVSMLDSFEVHSLLNARLPRALAACPAVQSERDSRRCVMAHRSSGVWASLSTAWSHQAQFPMAQHTLPSTVNSP
eukprot:CAMPEP_0173448130 /NCGR_PEP_ID=MMETSP1357-20121228/40168_1 /TAXON_ID=77926 /ORGANISM="Hemiselmis rufescens, Strain PCC563" /LENGTH=79 /DNA_ID=CAMNT_0014414607 /DNA_START=23 /DNA_END=259 /DNA_ORIENTATION=+